MSNIDIIQYASDAWTTFWTPSFWLPPNITWSDFKDTEDVVYPKFKEICYPVAYSIIVVFIRLIIERYMKKIISPFCLTLVH